MEGLIWAFHTRDAFALAWPFFLSLAAGFALVQSDFVVLLIRHYAGIARFGRSDRFVPLTPEDCPSGMVIIPALLRSPDDLSAITTTVDSCASNGYPGALLIIASVDGRNERPDLYRALVDWMAARPRPANIDLQVGGTDIRRGKMMAVEAGVTLVKDLVASGGLPAIPDLYFSIDGDGTLSPDALQRLAVRLKTPHPLTGNPRRVVSGKIFIRPDLFWGGWRQLCSRYFSIPGQIHLQVAREFLLSNIARFNWKLAPQIGIPGALYCTWSPILLEAPRYMGFMKTIRFRQYLAWWLGVPPPAFSKSPAAPCPEALTGASDDTCLAFLASIACWREGRLSFDAPATPLHALVRLIKGYALERSHDYEPLAYVYTYTPSTLNGLWKQRVRWNSSRFECAGRFWRAFLFHWEIGLPTGSHLWLVLRHVVELSIYYLLLPYFVVGHTNVAVAYVMGYLCQTFAYGVYTGFALLLEREWRKYLPALLALPLAPLYLICINFFGCVVGVVRDVFLFGNPTNFAPEQTLREGRTERIAILFRIRRFLSLCLRALLIGDVPWGRFWFGWSETRWTPSGYDGWTTGKPPRPMVPWAALRRFLRRAASARRR